MTTDEAIARVYIDHLDELMIRLGDHTAKGLANAVQMWQAGLLDTDDLRELIVQIVASVNAHARGAADVFGTRAVQDLTDQPNAVPQGVAAVDSVHERERLGKAAATFIGLLDTGEDTVTDRLERFGRDEPAEAAQRQLQRTYRAHGIDGYTRGLNAGACELCVWLRKEHLRPGGFVYPNSKPMHRHVGCRCTPIPTRKEIDNDDE